MLMMIDTLNAILHKSGGKLTRNEKWHGKLMPDQHKKLGVWGCGAVLHLQHGARGHVGGPGKLPKLDSPGELCAYKQFWLTALVEEYQSHCDLKTMSDPVDPKDLPPGVRPIPFDLIGKVKR